MAAKSASKQLGHLSVADMLKEGILISEHLPASNTLELRRICGRQMQGPTAQATRAVKSAKREKQRGFTGHVEGSVITGGRKTETSTSALSLSHLGNRLVGTIGSAVQNA